MIPKELKAKIEKFGLDDVTKLAPIGHLGYINGWGTEENELWKAVRKQGFQETSSKYNGRGWNWGCIEPLGMTYEWDSSD